MAAKIPNVFEAKGIYDAINNSSSEDEDCLQPINIEKRGYEFNERAILRKTNKMKTIAKSAILVKAGARKRKVQETLGQLFSSNGNEIEEYANKRKKIEVNKQTKTETKKQTKRVMWTRSATKVSIGGTEETVKTFTCSLL